MKTIGKARHLEYIDETEDLVAFYAQGGADPDAFIVDDKERDGVTAGVKDLHIRTTSFKSNYGAVNDDDESDDNTPVRSSRLIQPPTVHQPIPRSTDVFTSPLKRRRTNDSEPLPTVPSFSNNPDKHNTLPSISPALSFADLQSPTYPFHNRSYSANNPLDTPGTFDYGSLLNLSNLGSPPTFLADPNSPFSSIKFDASLENLPSTPSYTGKFSPALHHPPADHNPLPTSLSWTWSTPTLREAILMRYFIDHLAHWFDLCDPERHFALVVPQKARHCPPLLNAIFTASARHLTHLKRYKQNGQVVWGGHLLQDLKPETALQYHNKSINYLIQLSVEPDQIHNENLLAAAIILRFYEEVDAPLRANQQNKDSEEDEVETELFLKVSNLFINAQAPAVPRIPHTSPPNAFSTPSPDVNINTIQATMTNNNQTSPASTSTPDTHHRTSITDDRPTPRVTRVDGLRQACFWIAFRQEIYTAFMMQRAPNLPLDRCEAFRSFTPAEDAVWADRLIVFCADVLTFCHGGDSGGKEKERWEELKATERRWSECLPTSFEPIYFREPDRAGRGEVFPEIWYLADCHVAGVQHVELARILLGVYNPTLPRLGPGHVAAMNKLSAELKAIVLRLCGIALSNQKAPPGLVTACMGVAMCGEHFTDRTEQIALLGVLEVLEREHAWPTGRTVGVLKNAWGWT